MPDDHIVPTPSCCHCEEERRSNPEEGKGKLPNRKKPIAQIFPPRIHPLNQRNLFRPRPRLDLFLPTDCPLSGIEPLVVDKAVEPIALTESRVGSVLVLPDSALHLPRHSGG